MYKCLCILRDMCRPIHRYIHSQGHLNTQNYSHIHRHEHCDSQNSLGLTAATNYPYDAELWESSEIMLAIFWNVQCYIYKYKIIATYILCHIVWKCWGVSYKWMSTQLKNITFNIYMNIYYIYNVFHTFLLPKHKTITVLCFSWLIIIRDFRYVNFAFKRIILNTFPVQ